MSCGVLRAADVKVDIAPVFVGVLAHEGLVVVRVFVAQVISRRACEAGHRIQLQGEDALIVNLVNADYLVKLRVPGPHLSAAQWWLARFGRFVLADFGQLQGQTLFGNHVGHVVLVIYREWLAPIALAAEDGVAQTIVHFHAAQAFFGDEFLRGGDGLLHGKSVQ